MKLRSSKGAESYRENLVRRIIAARGWGVEKFRLSFALKGLTCWAFLSKTSDFYINIIIFLFFLRSLHSIHKMAPFWTLDRGRFVGIHSLVVMKLTRFSRDLRRLHNTKHELHPPPGAGEAVGLRYCWSNE